MDSKLTVVIAEDNIEAQEIMKTFVDSFKGFKVIGIANTGESLLELNIQLNPDLIIAHIYMPKLNGVNAIKSCLKINPELKFIFTTAYDQYAVEAFDINAIDYVMKPIKKERLYVALEKARLSLNQNKQVANKHILTIKMDRTSYFIHFPRIIFLEKDRRKTIIHTLDQKYETNESLEFIHEKLNHNFFRAHRSFIVNLNYISHITFEGETYFAHFRDYPHYAHVSKNRKKELYKELSYNPENSK